MKKIYLFFIYTIFACFLCFNFCAKPSKTFVKSTGFAFGTKFHIRYFDSLQRDFKKDFYKLFQKINHSLSTYDPNSIVSKINQGDTTVKTDAFFEEVFYKSLKIYQQTEGFFDPSIGVLVNAWGFGPNKKREALDDKKIAQLLEYVGFEDNYIKNHHFFKKHPKTYLDFNAIAKGYGVDIIGRFLEEKNIRNYLVEIGGEIRARGKNHKEKPWKIGIERPHFDGKRSIQKVIELKDESIATSGNYRKYEIDPETGKKYVHTINPKTGRTSKTNILSASVMAGLDCADVDAYATALMAMDFEKAKRFIQKYPNLKIFLIYIDKQGNTKEYINF